MAPLLSVKGLTLRRDDGEGSAILNSLNLDVEEGEVVVLRGESGCGKTTLLKCIAELNVYQAGEIRLNGKTCNEYGVPRYRTLVQYVPQRPSMLPGTPQDLLTTIKSFKSRQTASEDKDKTTKTNKGVDPVELAAEWGIDKTYWMREWSTLSGGEGQRMALAIAIGIGRAEVILLDEPTSALDADSMKKVEDSIIGMLPPLKTRHSSQDGVERKGTGPKALIWITHEDAQADRVGTRTVNLSRQ